MASMAISSAGLKALLCRENNSMSLMPVEGVFNRDSISRSHVQAHVAAAFRR